jgi:hypothetical protein
MAVVNVNSYGLLIRNGILERCKLVPPFTSVARFSRTSAKPVQAEQIPYLGVYYMGEQFNEDGANNLTEPHFMHKLKLGFSYIIQNNDPELAEELADAGHWSIMKLLHDPAWHTFPGGVRIQSITGGECDHLPGAVGRNNETPTLELQMSLTLTYGTRFEAIVNDIFERMHFQTVYPYPDDPNRQPIIAEWVMDVAEPKQASKSKE